MERYYELRCTYNVLLWDLEIITDEKVRLEKQELLRDIEQEIRHLKENKNDLINCGIMQASSSA